MGDGAGPPAARRLSTRSGGAVRPEPDPASGAPEAGQAPPQAGRGAPGRPADSPGSAAGGSVGQTPAAAPGRVVLIGTGHVFRIQDAVRGAIQALEPDVVFVELDRGRLEALLHRERTGRRPEVRGGFVHSRLQKFQEGVAGLYGAEVGSEMVAAVHGAQDVGARLVLVDAPGEDTIRRALREMTGRERLRAVGHVITAGFRRLVPAKGDARQNMDEEIRRYQEDPAAALEELRRMYPTVHRVLIDERDETMARRIRHAMAGARLGVAVVGDGHVNGLHARLDDMVQEVHRLADVRQGRLPSPQRPTAFGDASDVSFGFDVQW